MARPCSAPIASGLNRTTRHRPRRDLLRQALEEQPHRLRHHGGRRREPPDHRDPPYPQIHRCAGWIDKQPRPWKERIRFGALDMSATYAAVYTRHVAQGVTRSSTPSMSSLSANRALDAVRRRVQPNRPGTGADVTTRSIGRGGSCCAAKNTSTPAPPSVCGHCSPWAIPGPRWPLPIGSRSTYTTSIEHATSTKAEAMLRELEAHCRRRTMPPEIQRLGRTLAGLVRQDRQLPSGPGFQRPDRSAQQPDQAHQTDRLRLPQLRELPDPCAALRRQAELACARFDRRPVRSQTPPDSEEPSSGDRTATSSDCFFPPHE